MFDLDKAIAEWRRQMLASGIKSADILDELESHLRDDFEEQLRSGLNEEQAFQTAKLRIGQAGALQTEFAKLRPAQRRLGPRMLRMGRFGLAPVMLLINVVTLVQAKISPTERAAGLFVVTLISLYLASLSYWVRLLSRSMRGPGIVAGIKVLFLVTALWPLAALLDALKVIHFEMGITFTMITWSLYAAIAFTFVAWDFMEREPREADGFFPVLTDFTPVAQMALASARQEASSFKHDFIGTEHLLLGLLQCEDDVAPKLLRRLGISRDALRNEIENLVGSGSVPPANHNLPYTPRAKRALALATDEAQAMNHQRVGSAAMLIGLLAEGKGAAALALRNLDVDAETLRREILKELGR